ncbi:adenine-specific DNA methylase [Limosilactobacillus reuteri]|uniref:adenine-specific DNA methylase n=1 Tax=Limosilactobacillus reuteri TaxID=1598 RepID=UPI000B97F24D|nr:adenine-specific DNA methylase [Limosilactobacillus reuteri]OYS80638.1 adenine-specific DNA methylase [Limosilactobacillus reuteri]OYS81377.1 adenine-specific DNA methylase [Limosilactobacillus reuteri]OYS83696.1 adenine-specific DNA methylase [Limosilactobacillus reuteri]
MNKSVFMERKWAMPNKHTFSIPPIHKLLEKECVGYKDIIDPFANDNKEFARITNDLNPEMDTDYHLDAYDFLCLFPTNSVDMVLYDPPYSPRQVSESYKNVGHEVTALDTSAQWRKKHLDEIQRILRVGGKCISFGWNSNGVGKKRNFQIEQILLVAHGGSHNDTIVTVERKIG